MSMSTDFDRSFEAAFCGNKQMEILHKYNVTGNLWHICTVNSDDYYASAYYLLDKENMAFEFVKHA